MLDWQVVAHSIAHSLRSWLQSRIPASSDKCLQDGLCSDSKDKLTGKNPTCAKNLKVNPQSGDARTVQLQVNLKTVWWSAQKDEEVFMQLKISLLIFLTIIRFFHLSRLYSNFWIFVLFRNGKNWEMIVYSYLTALSPRIKVYYSATIMWHFSSVFEW